MIISLSQKYSKPLLKNARFFLATALLILLSHAAADEGAACKMLLKEAIQSKQGNLSTPQQMCPLAHTFVQWLSLQRSGSFEQIRAFLKSHPNWPRQSTLRQQAEKDLDQRQLISSEVIDWFKDNPPLSPNGLKIYAKAIASQGKTPDLIKRLNQSLIRLDTNGSDLKVVLKSHSDLFSKEILFQKTTLFLNGEDTQSAQALLPLLSSEHAAIVTTRIKLMKKDLSPSTASKAPKPIGLLFEHIRAHRKADQNEGAKALLVHVKLTPSPIDWADPLWKERNIIARRYLETADYQKAYDILQGHGLVQGENFANAEFLSGWIALRFLKKPQLALKHFENLHKGVKAPISVARACYWLGRTHQTLDNQKASQEWFEKARAHKATYYGQLAHKELTGQAPSFKPSPLPVDASLKEKFHNRELVKVIKMLAEIGTIQYVDAFAMAVSEEIQDYKELSLLVTLLHDKVSRSAALHTYKKTAKKHAPIIPAAYPRLDYMPSKTVNPAFAHAIVRQESRFQHDAVSSAGAEGLMQLMPATAATTAKAHNLKAGSLLDPKHNVTLGCLHLKTLLDKYGGSMILAAAAYNAGPVVDKWLVLYGDPRQPPVDAVDWVESIPYAETRNYVQRVMENFRCYG